MQKERERKKPEVFASGYILVMILRLRRDAPGLRMTLGFEFDVDAGREIEMH